MVTAGGTSVCYTYIYVRLIQTDGHSEVIAGIREAIHQRMIEFTIVWVTTAASLANNKITSSTFELALQRAKLKSRPFDQTRG